MGKGARNRKVRETALGAITSDMRKALQKEIDKQVEKYVLEADEVYHRDMDTCCLAVLADCFGFGPKQLRLFHDTFNAYHEEMRERYEIEDGESNGWYAAEILRNMGIDLKDPDWGKKEEDKLESFDN